jgi:hypothetical protein
MNKENQENGFHVGDPNECCCPDCCLAREGEDTIAPRNWVINGWVNEFQLSQIRHGLPTGYAVVFNHTQGVINPTPASLMIGDSAIPLSMARRMIPYMEHLASCLFRRQKEADHYNNRVTTDTKPCSCGLDELKEELRTIKATDL